MMNRRQMIGIAAGLAGATLATRSANGAPAATRRVFRRDPEGNGWREIAWEKMCPGERYLLLDLADDHLTRLTEIVMCPLSRHMKHPDGIPFIDTIYSRELLP